ncbi:MAG: hypothetical protein ACK5PQ_04115 [Alphaproteobacteria bacterium]
MQHRTFFAILFSMLFIWGTEGISASKQVLITFSSGKIFADGSLSQAGAYRSKQDLLKVWGVNNKNIIEKLFSAPSDADRLSVLVQNKDQIKNLPGVSLDFTSNMVTVNQPAAKPQPPKPAKKVKVQAVTAPAAASSVQFNPIDVQARDGLSPDQAAVRLQSAWRGHRVRDKKAQGDYESDSEIKSLRKDVYDLKKRYQRDKKLYNEAKAKFYEGTFRTIDEKDEDLKEYSENGEMSKILTARGMPLVDDLKDYDRHREEIEGEDRTPSLKKYDQPRGRNRNPSPDRGPDWEILNEFISKHAQNIEQGFKGLENDGLRKKLCVCVLEPDFYLKAQALGTLKRARLVSLCQGYAPEIAAQGKFIQRSRSASPDREKINLKKRTVVRLDPPSRGRSPSPVPLTRGRSPSPEPVVQVDRTPWVRSDTPPAPGATSVRTSRSPSPQRMTHAGGGANSSHVSDMTADPVPEEIKVTSTMSSLAKGLSEIKEEMQRKLLAKEKRKDLESQIKKVQKDIDEAKENYDNLLVIISVLKKDLPDAEFGFNRQPFKSQGHFQKFQKEHSGLEGEEYFVKLFDYLKPYARNLSPHDWAQIQAAENLLKQARLHLSQGQTQLARLNTEMLRLN